MTLVTATLNGPNNSVGRGYVRFTPLRLPNTPATALPLAKVVKIVDGAIEVELEPSGAGWAWTVTYQIYGLVQWTRHYLVPDSPTPVPISTLTEIDPLTTGTAVEPTPMWYSYVDQLVAKQVNVIHVITGTEPRNVTGSTVIWVGGTTQPVNMGESDIWFKATS